MIGITRLPNNAKRCAYFVSVAWQSCGICGTKRLPPSNRLLYITSPTGVQTASAASSSTLPA